MTAGLILAAGESRRMGSPKALLPFRETTFLDALCRLLAEQCSPVVVVLGASADEIRARSAGPATFVVNAHYLSGQTTSMQCGLRAVPPDAEGVLFTLVDHRSRLPQRHGLAERRGGRTAHRQGIHRIQIGRAHV